MTSTLSGNNDDFPERARALDSKLLRYTQIAILVASILISAAFILRDSGVVPSFPMDQHFVETVNIKLQRLQGRWTFQYPSLQNSGGITSSIIAGIYKLIVPTTHENLNWHIRIFAMATYLISTFTLIRTFLSNRAAEILAYLVIASSGFQLLQPSSDLFAGTLLNLFFVGAVLRWPRPLTALCLAAFGLCKVDMILAALLLGIFWSWWERRSGEKGSIRGLLYTILWMALFLFPGFIVQGANPLSGSRSMVAFMSAYTEFFGYHQFSPSGVPPTSASMEAVRVNVFNGATSFFEIVTKHPSLYLDFVGVSAARSLPNLVHVFKLMLIPIGIVYFQQKQIRENRFLFWGSIIAAICVILPAWLVIYLRLRYAVKIAAPLIVIGISGSLELGRHQPRYSLLAWLCGIGTILWGLWYFGDMAQYSHWK